MEDSFDLACKRMKLACEDASNPTDRKWEDLPNSCLALIFEKVGIWSLALSVPFVCKSWYEASRNPACWKVIDLRGTDMNLPNSSFVKRFKHIYRVNHFTMRGFLKFLIRCSNKSATKLFTGEVRIILREAILLFEQCPELEIITGWTQLNQKILREYILKMDVILGKNWVRP